MGPTNQPHCDRKSDHDNWPRHLPIGINHNYGFSVLTWDSLVPIQPMRTVGTTLLLGIFVTFLLSMVMVPALIQLLRYRKSTGNMDMSTNQTVYVSIAIGAIAAFALSYSGAMSTINSLIIASMLSLTIALGILDVVWESIGKIPVRFTIVVMLVAIVTTAGGVMILEEELGKDITGSSDEVPPGLESYEALRSIAMSSKGDKQICSSSMPLKRLIQWHGPNKRHTCLDSIEAKCKSRSTMSDLPTQRALWTF